ncbi:hypothetical protein, partial [Endozoicomonas sp. ONNA2]|uniref:hypothetical protein n=1 Tax=Endozoicomonas sp. ONNA2 TaxID=2828741 RepID=UPI002148F253
MELFTELVVQFDGSRPNKQIIIHNKVISKMHVSGNSPLSSVDLNPEHTQTYSSQPTGHFRDSPGHLWCNYLVKEASGGEQDGLPIRHMPYPSANAEIPMDCTNVQSCPGTTHDLPQGNLGPELKALLQRVAGCTDKEQPLPVSDYKPFIRYFGELPPNADPDQLDSEDYLIKVKKTLVIYLTRMFHKRAYIS